MLTSVFAIVILGAAAVYKELGAHAILGNMIEKRQQHMQQHKNH